MQEKKSEKEKEREAAIKQQEIDNLYGARHLEATALKRILTSRNLHIFQVGGTFLHCFLNSLFFQFQIPSDGDW
jgi:OTU domain-containing protein 6